MNTLGSSSKGFIFSIDAFIAFLIAMSMIYSIIFLSSVVTSKNDVILQMHTIADDVVVAMLSTTSTSTGTQLDNLASGDTTDLDDVVPAQYNYNVKTYDNGVWVLKGHRGEGTPMFGGVVVYAYSVKKSGGESTIIKSGTNPYKYISCGEGSAPQNGLPCSAPPFYSVHTTIEPVLIRITIWK